MITRNSVSVLPACILQKNHEHREDNTEATRENETKIILWPVRCVKVKYACHPTHIRQTDTQADRLKERGGQAGRQAGRRQTQGQTDRDRSRIFLMH